MDPRFGAARVLVRVARSVPHCLPLRYSLNIDMSLINKRYIRDSLNYCAHWAASHGSDENEYLGAGMFYYSLLYMLKARFCVSIGSGGGFVPRVMKQAQRDLDLSDARTVLIDANLAIGAVPQWLDERSFFKTQFPDVEIIVARKAKILMRHGCSA